MIKEFLEFYRLDATSSVFIPEVNLVLFLNAIDKKLQKKSRQELSKELKLTVSNDKPLLVEILSRFMKLGSSPAVSTSKQVPATADTKQEEKLQKTGEKEDTKNKVTETWRINEVG